MIKKIVKAKHRFERLELSKEEALDLFSYNRFKTYLIETKVPDDGLTSAYRVGDFIDLCTGPHLPHTGHVRAFKLMKNSATYWLGDSSNDSLQRIYGVSFPEKEQLKEYLRAKEEAEKRDHRLIGQKQDLFFWNAKYAPGSTFFTTHGTKIYNKLLELMKLEYARRGFGEVVTPNIYNVDLWKVSGHYRNFKDDLFLIPPTT